MKKARASFEALFLLLQILVKKSYLVVNIALLKFVRLCFRNSLLTLIVFALTTFFLLSQLPKTKIVFSAEDLAGQGIASADELKDIKLRYKDGITSTLVLTPPAGQTDYTAEELCRIRRWYSFQRNSIPSLKRSVSTFDFQRVDRKAEDRIGGKNLLDLDCGKEKLAIGLAEIKKELSESPFALVRNNSEKMKLVFQFSLNDAENSKYGIFDPRAFDEIRNAVKSELLPLVPNSTVSWIGPADYQSYLLEGFSFSKYVNLGMIVLLLLGLRLSFGTWRSGLIFCSSLLLTAIWVFGLKAFVGSSFDVMASGLLLIIGISSLEDFIFVTYEQVKGVSWRRSVRMMVLPSFYTSMTTIVGFLSLLVSPVETVCRMGVWASTGAAIEWLMIFILLPCFLKQFKIASSWVRVAEGKGIRALDRFAARAFPRWVSLASLLIFPLSLWAYGGIDYNVSPNEIFPDQHAFRRGTREFAKTADWSGVVSLLFESEVSHEEAERLQNELIQSAVGQRQISAVENSFEIGNWLARVGQIQVEDAVNMFKLTKAYEQFVDRDGRVRSLLYVRDIAVVPIQDLKKAVADTCRGRCHLGGEVVAYSDFSMTVSRTLMESLSSSLVLVALIIAWLAMAQKKSFLIPSLLASSFWGPMLMILVLGVSHSTLDFWKAIFASILVGLTGDNAVQYLFASRHRDLGQGVSDRANASILNSLLMAAGSLVYLGSYFTSPRSFGIILCIGLIASLVGDLWLMKGLLPSGDKSVRSV